MEEGICQEPIFEKVFMKQAEGLRNFLYYKVGDISRAEDLMQDAFQKLWENCAKVQPEKAKAFLFKVAQNLFFNQFAHQKVVLRFEQQYQAPTSTNNTPSQELEASELQTRLYEAIASLPESQRVVFLLNRVDGMTYSKIAENLDLSVKAIEKRMHKALKTLKKVVEEVGKEVD